MIINNFNNIFWAQANAKTYKITQRPQILPCSQIIYILIVFIFEFH